MPHQASQRPDGMKHARGRLEARGAADLARITPGPPHEMPPAPPRTRSIRYLASRERAPATSRAVEDHPLGMRMARRFATQEISRCAVT